MSCSVRTVWTCLKYTGTTLIPFRNGFTAVGCCPSDNLTEVYASLHKLREEEFCPADAWILNNE